MTAKKDAAGIALRYEVVADDANAVGEIVEATGFFNEAEVAIAIELVEARLQSGEASGYFFVLAEEAGRVQGYACYGPIEGTENSFDLFWIAIRPDQQGRGLGRLLMDDIAKRIHAMGGCRVYAETSGRAQYEPTREFYRRLGFDLAAELPEFYGPGDAKLFYVKPV